MRQTDDRALTRAVQRSALQLGAQLRCPARFESASLDEQGVLLRYAQGNELTECRARVLVNAAGPWAERVARLVTPAMRVPALECVQGTHLVLPGTLARGIYYLESPYDGRAVFVMPWKGQVMVGTTETRYEGDPALVAPTPAEIDYLLDVLKHYFPRWHAVAESDLTEKFAGLRVLPAGPEHAFARSRETQLIPDRAGKPRVLSIYGGKLTTWRAVSQRALEALSASLPRRRAVARTDRLTLQAPE